MKVFLIMIILVFTFSMSMAPVLSADARADNRMRVLNELQRMVHEKEFNRFACHLGRKESPDWTKINQIGCMGQYQFAPSTLKHLGYGHITPDRFRKDPEIFPRELQFRLLVALVKCNEITLRHYMSYVGETINGVEITKSGILAGAHLGGPQSVILYLQSHGRINRGDMNGTTIQDYIKEFQGYNI